MPEIQYSLTLNRMKKIKKYLITTTLFLFTTLSVIAQCDFSGKIISSSDELPVIGATVFIPEIKRGAVSDTGGNFKMSALPCGSMTLEVRMVGFKPQIQKISFKENQQLVFRLQPSVTEMDQVIITGMNASTQRILNPVPTAILNPLKLFENASTNLIDAISVIPGVNQVKTGNSVSKPVIRGMGFNRVLVLHDGVRQEGQQWGDEHGVEIDESSVDKIEVIKGPGSIMYGSDALAGVINFISMPTANDNAIKGNIQSQYQTNSNLLGYALMVEGNRNHFSWLIRNSAKMAGNYSNRFDGKVYNTAFKELNGDANVGWSDKWGYSFIRTSLFNQIIGLAEGDRNEDGKFVKQSVVNDSLITEVVTGQELKGYAIDVPRQQINHLRILSDSKFFFGDKSLATLIGYQQNVRSEYADPIHTNEAEMKLVLRTMNYDIKYLTYFAHQWRLVSGISGMFQMNKNEANEALIPDYQLFDAGLFITADKTIHKLFMNGGIRFDQRFLSSNQRINDGNIQFDGFDKYFKSISASAGCSYKFNDKFIVKANMANGYRAPNMAELASNGVHEGTYRYELGNKNLKPEKSVQTDLSWSYISEHIHLEADLFSSLVRNYIFTQRLKNYMGQDSIPDPQAGVPAYQFYQTSAWLRGFELSSDLHPHPLDWLHFENSFSLVEGTFVNGNDSTRNIPLMPSPQWKSELSVRLDKPFSTLRNSFLKFEWQYHFRQNRYYRAFNTETATPAYQLFSISAGFDVTSNKGEKKLSVAMVLDNIFNTAYQDHLSRYKYAPENLHTGRMGIFNQGRNFTIKIVVPFVVSKDKG
jgi:iron complex outermembrane receptor protein